MQADRRRINAPAGGTAPPVFSFAGHEASSLQRPRRTRAPDEHRKLFLRTGVVPSASGSAYYEVPPVPETSTAATAPSSLVSPTSSVKITCTVHGPRPLPRNAAFSPNMLLSAHVKFAPFATRQRRGYVRDAAERDLGAHLEAALRGAVIGERWRKSACEVVITVLEGEEDAWWGQARTSRGVEGLGLMGVLSGCITVACAALVDAGIDCVDLVSGGVAAIVSDGPRGDEVVVLDPAPADHDTIKAACVVGYLQTRDEITELWTKGDTGDAVTSLIDHAIKSAVLTRTVLAEAIKEAVELKIARGQGEPVAENGQPKQPLKGLDVTMKG